MTEHNILTDPDLHEPKGIAAASAETFYTADGAGSGSWKKLYLQGSEVDSNALPAQNIGVGLGARTYLMNDTAGVGTTSVNRTPSKTDVWNGTTHAFNFSSGGYSLGDTALLTLKVDINSSATGREIVFGFECGIGAVPEVKEINRIYTTIVGNVNDYVVTHQLTMQNTNMLNNTCKFFVYSDGAGDTCLVKDFTTTMLLRNPVAV